MGFAARLRTPHVRADHLPRVARGIAAAVARVHPARELIVVGVSNGAVCASALAEETRADAVLGERATPSNFGPSTSKDYDLFGSGGGPGSLQEGRGGTSASTALHWLFRVSRSLRCILGIRGSRVGLSPRGPPGLAGVRGAWRPPAHDPSRPCARCHGVAEGVLLGRQWEDVRVVARRGVRRDHRELPPRAGRPGVASETRGVVLRS